MARPRPVLSEMPFHVLTKIIKLAGGTVTRCRLRKCSKSLQYAVDHTSHHFDSFSLSIQGDNVDIMFEESTNSITVLNYNYHPDGCLVTVDEWYGLPRSGKILYKRDFAVQAVDDLCTLLKNPNLTIGKFKVVVKSMFENNEIWTESVETFLNKFHEKFGRHRHKLRAEEFFIHFHDNTQNEVLHFLPHFEPKWLKTIKIEKCGENQGDLGKINQITELEQWKNAEHLDITHISEIVPGVELKNFKTISVGVPWISSNNLKELVEAFTHSQNFVHCQIICTDLSRHVLKMQFGESVSLDPKQKFERVIKSETGNDEWLKITVHKYTIDFVKILPVNF
uniref:FTH domain-containing protein n=1 Tax=Caenorhabditis japonica TaxID=281687 RepID=A0A8R1DJ47_CAEJA